MNRLTIGQDRLEVQLLMALQEQIGKPSILDFTLLKFEQEVRKRPSGATPAERWLTALVTERERLGAEAYRLVEAVAQRRRFFDVA